jgi:hypothetical protein
MLKAKRLDPSGKWLMRIDEPVEWKLAEAARVLAVKHPVVPQRWGVLTLKGALHDAARDHSIVEPGRAAEVVLGQLEAAALRAAENVGARAYRPADPARWADDAARYEELLMESGVWARVARSANGYTEHVVTVYAARYFDVDQAARMVAGFVGKAPGVGAGRRTAYEALVAATKRRDTPPPADSLVVDGVDLVAAWAKLLVKTKIFPAEALKAARPMVEPQPADAQAP